MFRILLIIANISVVEAKKWENSSSRSQLNQVIVKLVETSLKAKKV